MLPLLCALSACTDKSINTLSIGTFNWIGYQPFYIAKELGFYKDSHIKLVELNNSTDIMYALSHRQLDGATLTLDEVITLLHDGIDLSVVLIVDISNGADALLSKPGFDSMTTLTGKRIAVEYTAVGAMLLHAALNKHDMKMNEIQIVHCASDMHLDCYKENDGIVTFEPIKTKLVNQGANVVFDSSEVSGRIVDVLVMHNEIIEEKKDVIKKLIAGYYDALEYIVEQPDEANRIIQKRTKLELEEIRLMFNGIEIPGRLGNPSLISSSELKYNALLLNHIMKNNGFIKNLVSMEKLFTDKLLPE